MLDYIINSDSAHQCLKVAGLGRLTMILLVF